MRNAVAAVAVFFGFGLSTAIAADLLSRNEPLMAPIPAAPFSWTGFYAGLHAGAAHGRINALDVRQPNGGFYTDLVPAGTEGFGFGRTSLAAGGHAGAQYQWQQFVVGVEASWTWTDVRQTIVSPYFPASDIETGRLRDVLQIVGRVGFAFDRFLIYAKGGFASGEVGFRARDNQALFTYTQNNRQYGYVLGAGFDYAFTNNWIFGLDYAHIQLGAKTGTGNNIRDDGVIGVNPEFYRTKASADMVTARISYRF